jgi:hypothetical protein
LWIAIPRSTPSPEVAAREEKTASIAQPPSSASPSTPTAPAAAAEPPSVQNAAALAKTAALLRDEARRSAYESQVTRERVANQQLANPQAAGPQAANQQAADAAVAGALPTRLEAEKRETADNAAAPRPFAVTARLGASPSLEIVAPGGSDRWRIVGGQQVEWSTSAASGWRPAAIETLDVLTAGASPSPSVCWIVGRRGAVYVTTDGRRFMRVPFPEMADLVKVTATDDRTATVSGADGRSWNTTDQGQSWAMAR